MTVPRNRKVPYEVIEDREALLKYLAAWHPCHQIELEAAAALLEYGMEERPLHAMERAHVVLMAIGAIPEWDEEA